jgi:FtsH-binding integral membrane protein
MPVLNAFLAKVVIEIINPIILLLSAAAFVVFLWGVFEFIVHADDEGKRTEGKSAIFWGLIGLVIIFGAYGIINLALGTQVFGPSDVPNDIKSIIQG